MMVIISINGFSQFSYGPRIGTGIGIPSISSYGSSSQIGELTLESSVNFNVLLGFFLNKQFDSNFMVDFDALFHAPTKIKFLANNQSQEVRYKAWHLNLNVGTKINYNIRGFAGFGISYPLLDDDDLQALGDQMSGYANYGGEPFANLGIDYYSNNFTIGAVMKFPLNFWGPFIDVYETFNDAGYNVNLSILELRYSHNLNK